MSQSNHDADRVGQLVQAAANLAAHRSNEYFTVDHLAQVCMEDEAVVEKLKELKFDIDGFAREFREYMDEFHPSSANATGAPRDTASLHEVVKRTVSNMMFARNRKPGALDVLVAIMKQDQCYAAYFLSQHGLDVDRLKQSMADDAEVDGVAEGGEEGGSGGKMDNMTPEKALKILNKFCTNLNAEAFKGKIDPLIGREDDVYKILKTISRRTKNNVIMTGEPGVGKTAIVEGLARLIVDNDVPEAIQGSTIWSLNVTALVAGSKFRGDMEERAQMVLTALTKVEKPILFIDEIHMIMGAGAAGKSDGMDLSNMMKPALARGQLRCIGSTTMDEYRKHFEKDKALMRRFQNQNVDEPSVEDAKRIMHGAKKVYEAFHGVTFTDEAIDTAVELTHRYVTNRFLPDKAFDVIDAAGATQRIATPETRATVITDKLIEVEISKMAKIPERTVSESEGSKLAHLESDLTKVVYGQAEAVTELTDAVILARSGLREGTKPAGIYLFKGPTGVGKTEVSKQLAATLGIPLLRYNMSEYMQAHTVSKLIGSPPGYVGYGDGQAGAGKLITDIETNPYSVLLLDEFEKAHQDVYNIFLQVFDNAELESSDGKKVNFQNVIVILTSNVGARFENKAAIGFGKADRNAGDDKILKDTFSPEFLNRLDAIVSFNALAKDTMNAIVDKFIDRLRAMAKEKNVTIDLTEDARDWLAEKGYDPDMGARPLERVIRDNITKPLSKAMLFGEVKNGGNVVLGVVDDKIALAYGELPKVKMPETEAAEV